jgi:hypothetical protein
MQGIYIYTPATMFLGYVFVVKTYYIDTNPAYVKFFEEVPKV